MRETIDITPQEFERLKQELPPEALKMHNQRKSAEVPLKVLAIFFPPLTVLLCRRYWAALLNLIVLWPLGLIPGILHAYWIVNRYTMSFALDQNLVDGIRHGAFKTPRGTRFRVSEAAVVRRQVEKYVNAGLKVQAIKHVREATGWGLREAKDYVDALLEGRTTYQRLEAELIGRNGTVQVGAGEAGAIPENVRQAVLDRDDYICRYCGQRSQTMEIDHVVPVIEGGKSTLDNLVTACRACNRRKGGRTPEVAGMKVLPVRSQVRNR